MLISHYLWIDATMGGLTAWLNGSGGADKTPHHYRAISGKTRPIRERRSRCPFTADVWPL
jgi:hypothetical protein